MADDQPLTKARLWKNHISVCAGFMLLFVGFQGLSSLQSSLHRVEGLGVINQAILYGVLVVSCMFLPPVVIGKIGRKWTLAIGMVGYVLWMAANMYAVWGTMVTASIIVGITASMVWAAQSAYTTECANQMAALTGEVVDDVMSKFFGIFIMFFQSAQIFGNLVSSLVLSQRPKNAPDITEEDLKKCGSKFCPDTNMNSTGLEKPPNETVWTLVGIYMTLGVLAIAVVIFLTDNMKREGADSGEGKFSAALLISTFQLLTDKRQLLLLPITTYIGIGPAFLMAEFTKAFVGCSVGMWNIGFVMLAYGATSTACSLLAGYAAKLLGRLSLMIGALCIQLALLITLALWMPHPDRAFVLFLISGLWGVGDANLMSQSNALYGVLFSDNSDAAFSNYRMWNSIGFVIGFSYSNFVCVDVKIYVLIGILVVSVPPYLYTEYLAREKTNSCDIPPLSGIQPTRELEHYTNPAFTVDEYITKY